MCRRTRFPFHRNIASYLSEGKQTSLFVKMNAIFHNIIVRLKPGFTESVTILINYGSHNKISNCCEKDNFKIIASFLI